MRKKQLFFILASFIAVGCSKQETVVEESLPHSKIREQIMAAAESLSETDQYNMMIETHMESETEDVQMVELLITTNLTGTIRNQSRQFYLDGQLKIENLSKNEFRYQIQEPEHTEDVYPHHDFYKTPPLIDEMAERSIQVTGLPTEMLPDEPWTDYGEEVDYVVFHNLADGRMRYYIDENENHFYSNRMDRTFSFLSEYAQDLEMNENDGKIEITGVVSEINRDLFDAFWIDPHAYLYRYFYQPLHFSLLLEEDTNLPLQLTLQNTEGETIEDDELLKQKSSFTLTFSGYNEAAYAFEIPTKEETLYAPNGFSDFEEAFVNDTTIAALPEIIEAPVDSGKLQLYESIITLPVTGQELLDLGFTP